MENETLISLIQYLVLGLLGSVLFPLFRKKRFGEEFDYDKFAIVVSIILLLIIK